MSQTPSPFKFLDAFTFSDRKNFFGRVKEVDILYRVVQRTPLLLLYGLSGTGKTSLVQCGLAARFDGPDWLPIWIRREDHLLRSLHKEIDRALTAPVPEGTGAPEKIQTLYRQYLRPVFLLFDQFEELLILGDTTERNAFVAELKSILEAGLPCTILLIIREEYLGRLYPLEKDIHNLFDFRMRVEPMDTANVAQVLKESFSIFNIQLEAPAEERIQEIIKNIRLKDTLVELPHLQVYLDRMYRTDFERDFPNGVDLPQGAWPSLEFTQAEIATLGTIENVLDEFLLEQRQGIQQKLEERFPNESGTEYAVDHVLSAFVSAEGTKRPISVTEEDGYLAIGERQRALFPALSPEVLSWCIQQLTQARILRPSGGGYELTHDTLATAVERQQNGEQKQLADARRRIELGYKDYVDTQGQFFFDQAMLFRLEPYLSKLVLPEEWASFVDSSYAEVKRGVDRESERQQRELQLVADKLAVEEQARILALEKTKEAEEERDKAQAAREEAERNLKKYEAASAEIVEALVREANELIYCLDYTGAAAKLRTAADLNQPTDSFIQAVAEVAFFWNEAGLTEQAADLLVAAKQSSVPRDKGPLQTWLKLFAGASWYDTLWWRYYPTMLPVAGGEAHIDGKIAPVSAFKMARTQTTMWQYALYFASLGKDMRTDQNLSSDSDLSWGFNGDNPVVEVSWYDAARYANWLSKQANLDTVYVFEGDYFKEIDYAARGYRLPTEVEWEYAARGGPAHEVFEYAGGYDLDAVGWYRANSRGRTQPVACKTANCLGLYDMSGNVSEWCSDWYSDYPATFSTNYHGPDSGENRVSRGGDWSDSAWSCWSAHRVCAYPFSSYFGFRLVFVP
ncbi:MAG: SUMF1/EgtB/PvdO family nonheme iron enzyme [Saprospiraceae bacterium]